MSKVLMILMIVITISITPAYAIEGGVHYSVKEGEAIGQAVNPRSSLYYKSKEEIAWDLLMYGLNNITTLRSRIKQYEDLLEIYRRTLNMVNNPKEPVPEAPAIDEKLHFQEGQGSNR